MPRRVLLLLLLPLLAAEDARASCAPPNPRAQLEYADAAFDGRFVSERSDGHSRWLTFRVDRVLKGELGSTVEIHERGVSTINLGRFQPDERVALTMNFSDGAWLSNDCQRYDPEELADAVEPLPRPPGRGRAAYLVTGWFGNAGGALLDRRGRTLAYAFHSAFTASVCPGGRRIALLGGTRIRLLRTRDLRVVDSARRGSTHRVHCLGRVVVRATSSGLFRGNRRIWRGTWRGMAFHGRHAFVALDDLVSRVDLVTGAERAIADVAATGDVAVSPDGRRLALVTGSRVTVVDVRSGRVRTADATGYAVAAWAGRDRLVLMGLRSVRAPQPPLPPARFLDASLRPVGEVPAWAAFRTVGVGGALVGIAGHRVERATPAGASELGRLPSSQVSGIHRLPRVAVRASRRVPRY